MAGEELSKRYDPSEVGSRWYRHWLDNGYFHAKDEDDRPPFSIVIPPPNVTGSLHLGHALDNTLQDILIRHARMSGHNTLWMPGTDHAGIATQNVVEKHLKSEGISRHELGREKFVERVWEWREQYGGTIMKQLEELGASCDWERTRFTLDDGLSRAVREVFVSLYEEGLIYRAEYITNWCPRCHTALSDLEVEYEDRNGHLWEIEYPLSDGSGSLIVATTRPETMLGDTAVAVNPEDERYKAFIGKTVKLPLVDREIPVIGDEYVEMEFGTGALKITPAHDPNDFEIGRRHDLDVRNVMTDDARMKDVPAKYDGLSREEARKLVVKDLEEQDLLKGIEKHSHAVGDCYRCKTIIEPRISMQWFVKTAPLAEKAIEAVKKGEIEFVPKNWENTYFEWMNNIRDWCISRQIWWGHRIPVWYCDDCGEMTVTREDPETCGKCGSANIRQDQDVLDTWFSSGLWPFSTMGWPEKTKTLDTFYPTSVLVTGFDIIFFWVARMIMMGLKFTGKPPFRKVYIHALIRDASGQKMSKSKGNVIDPLELMHQYGADSLRFTLCALESQGRDIKLSEKRIEGYRNFVNKLWNASRFVLMNVDSPDDIKDLPGLELTATDRWILSRLQKTAAAADTAVNRFRFNDLASSLYAFTWNEFCDWYIELSKTRLQGDDKTTPLSVLVYVLDRLLRLLHPVMPFVTEEIYQKLPGHGESIMVQPYPKPEERYNDEKAEAELRTVMDMVTSIRNIRAELKIPHGKKLKAMISFTDNDMAERIQGHLEQVTFLGKLEDVETGVDMERPAHSATGVLNNARVFVPLEGVIDLDEEKARIEKEIAKAEKDIAFFDKKFANENFVKNAPREVLEKDMAKHEDLKARLGGLKDSLGWIS